MSFITRNNIECIYFTNLYVRAKNKRLRLHKRLSTATALELILAETDTEDEVRSQFTGSIRTKQRE